MRHHHKQNVQGELCCPQHKALAMPKNIHMFANKCKKYDMNKAKVFFNGLNLFSKFILCEFSYFTDNAVDLLATYSDINVAQHQNGYSLHFTK
jgi:hypothetical protein